MNPPCNPRKTTSSGYSNGWATSISNYSSPIQKLDEAMRKLPESTPYVGPEFVPYTQPSQSFIPEPKYIPPTVNTPPSYSTGDNYVVQELTTNLNKWQNIGYIDFSGKQLSDGSCRQFNEAFRDAKLPNLLTLVLSNNQISDSGGQYLTYSLIHHYNNNLTTLILANNNLTNNGVTPFADGFNQINTTTFPNGAVSRGQITKLKTLDLRGNSKICFSGKLYFFQGIDKCKTKDTSILFDEFTIKTGDIHFLTSNNKLLNDSHISWITGAFHYQWFASIHNLNLGNNQIGNDGAKLLAVSLSKGEMPNLKKLHLEGNNITDEGVSYYLDNLKKDQLNNTYVSLTTSKSTIDKIMEFFGKGARYYVSEYEKAQQSSKEADIAVNGKDGFGHCVQVVRTAGIDVATAMAQKAIAMPPIVKKVVEKSPVQVKLIVGGGLVISSLDEVKGAFLSEDFAYCMAWFNQEIIGDNGHENSDI